MTKARTSILRGAERLHTAGTLLLLHLLAAIGGYCADLLRIPLPWMIGSLAVAATARLSLGWEPPPVITRRLGQLVIASAIGLYLTIGTVFEIIANAMPILLAAILVIAVASLIAAAQARFGGYDRATALFSCIPGGPAEMATLAEANRGNGSIVALSQALRIVAIICVVPPFLILTGESQDTLVTDGGSWTSPTFLLTILCGTASALGMRLIGPLNAFFLGPLLGVGALTAAGVDLPRIPWPYLAGAQVLLGVSLGAVLRRDLFHAGLRFVMVTLATTAALLGSGIGLAVGAVGLFDMEFPTMVLATAPGSVTEMAVTAQTMHLDVALVVAFHLVRIVLVILIAPLLLMVVRRW